MISESRDLSSISRTHIKQKKRKVNAATVESMQCSCWRVSRLWPASLHGDFQAIGRAWLNTDAEIL